MYKNIDALTDNLRLREILYKMNKGDETRRRSGIERDKNKPKRAVAAVIHIKNRPKNVYAKNEQSDLSSAEKKALKSIVMVLKEE